MNNKDRVLHEMLQMDKGRAWLAHYMIHGRNANRDVFEREYTVRRMQAEAGAR
jgi:hypothetical protein